MHEHRSPEKDASAAGIRHRAGRRPGSDGAGIRHRSVIRRRVGAGVRNRGLSAGRRTALLVAVLAAVLAGVGTGGISGYLASGVSNGGNTFEAADDFGSP